MPLNRDHVYAFYGSLRQGMINHEPFSHGLEYLFTETLPGFRLHALRRYPYAVQTNDPGEAIVVEVFRVTDPWVEGDIHELEISVGYTYREVEIRGMLTGIYLFENQGPEPSVKGGDWVKFFGSR